MRAESNNLLRRIPNAAWAWEGLRRNPAYRQLYLSSRSFDPEKIKLASGAHILRSYRRHREAEKWGLLYPANPGLSAFEAKVIWHPDVLAGALDVRLSRAHHMENDAQDAHDTIILSTIQSRRLIYEMADGTRHILLNGKRFWVQLQCRPPAPIGEQSAVSIHIDGAEHGMRRIDTIRQLFALHRSAGGKMSLIGRKKNSRKLEKSLCAYDIAYGFERPKGDLKDVALMINGPARIQVDWAKDNRALKQQARRAIASGKALVSGGYRDLLSQKSL